MLKSIYLGWFHLNSVFSHKASRISKLRASYRESARLSSKIACGKLGSCVENAARRGIKPGLICQTDKFCRGSVTKYAYTLHLAPISRGYLLDSTASHFSATLQAVSLRLCFSTSRDKRNSSRPSASSCTLALSSTADNSSLAASVVGFIVTSRVVAYRLATVTSQPKAAKPGLLFHREFACIVRDELPEFVGFVQQTKPLSAVQRGGIPSQAIG